jgi:hypothetical protein
MTKSVKHFALLAGLFAALVSPALAQSKGSRARSEQTAPKADRGRGGEAAPDRANRSQSVRGEKSDGRSGADRPPQTVNKRRR